MKTFAFDAPQEEPIKLSPNVDIKTIHIKKLKHYLRYYSTTLSYSKFNFDYEGDYLDFVRNKVKLMEDELERRRVKYYRITDTVMLNFLTHNDSYDVLFRPKPSLVIKVDHGMVSVREDNGPWMESNNTVGSINDYLKTGSIAEIKMKEEQA
jgi:hypothetical protein